MKTLGQCLRHAFKSDLLSLIVYAKRLGVSVDNKIVAQSAHLVLTEAINMKPGRSVENYLENLLTRVLGTVG